MNWIRIDCGTVLPKDKKLICFLEKENNYEILSFWGMSNEGQQIWHTGCGDDLCGTLEWFDEHILGRYTFYSIIEKPEE